MAVQWDKEKGLNGWGVDFWNTIRGIKKDLPEVNKEIKKFIGNQNDLKGKNTEALEWIRPQLLQDAEELSNVTDELRDDFTSFLETADLSGDILKQYQAHLKKTGKSVNDFSSFTKKAGSVLKSFRATLGSMFVNWAIGKIIDVAATAFDNLANASKHAAESAQVLASEMNTSISSMSSNASTLSDLNDEYQTLSKGVNKLGENISLSTEDYSRYKDIINQVSTIMPSLTTYFNAQGEKIAFAKGELEDLNKEYGKYIQKQAIEYITKGDSEGHKIQDILDNYNNNESLSGFEKFWNDVKNSFGFVDIEDFSTKEILNKLKELRTAGSIDEINALLNGSFLEDISYYHNPSSTSRDNLLKEAIKELLQITTQSDYNALMDSITSYIQTYEAKITSDMNQVRTALFQETYSKDEYWQIEDSDVRNDITTFLSSIDSDLWDFLNKKTYNEVSIFINKIIESISENKDGFADAWNGLFDPELENLPVDDYAQQIDDFIKTICNVLGLDETDGVPILKASLGFDDVDDTTNRLQNAIRMLTDDHGIQNRAILNSDEYAELVELVKDLTFAEAELCLEAISDADNIAEAVAKVKEALSSTIEDGGIKTFSQAWSDLFTSEKESVKKLGETLLGLAEKGQLTVEAFNEADSTGYFKNLGISADEAVNKINQLVDKSSQLSSMSSQISKISEALASKRDDGFVSADTLSGFDAEIRGLDSWDHFQEVLGNVNSSYQKCQEAANALASEWVNSNDFLAQLTEQNKEYYATQLKAMGVENYEELLTYAMELDTAKKALSLASFDLADATAQEVEQLINDGIYSDLAQQKIWNLVWAKQTVEETNLNTADDCQRLLNLAKNAGVTGQSIDLLTELMRIYNNLENGVYGTNKDVLDEVKTRAEAIKQNIINLLSDNANETAVLKPKLKLSPSTKAAAKKAGKETGKSYLDGLKEELSKMGSIISYVSKILGKKITSYGEQKDDAVKGLEAQKDAAKEALEAQKNAADEASDATKKALEAQKDATQAQIDAKQEEIDKIKEASEARKNEINLQKAQYDLARMQNQKTSLIYSEDKGMHYVTDTKGIRDAKDSVTDAKENIRISSIEKEISALEKTIDAINKQTEALEEQASATSDYYDTLMEESDAYYDQLIEDTEAYWDSLIKGLEDYQTRWEELADIEEEAKMNAALKELGITTEEILNMSEEDFEIFKQKYLAILTEIYAGNEDVLSALQEASGISVESLQPLIEELQKTIEKTDEYSESADNAKIETDNWSIEIDELASSADGASESIGNLNTELGNVPSTEGFDAVADVLDRIRGVADAVCESVKKAAGELNYFQGVKDALEAGANVAVDIANKTQTGKAYASGTGISGLDHAEKNALRSEYGQKELTVYPNGDTELTTSPVMSDLPKGTVVYNEEQTKKIMDNKPTPVGNAHADGTDDSIWTTLADGTKVRPLQPGDRMYDLVQKFDSYFKSMDGNLEKLVPNSFYEHQRQMEDMAKQINYVSNIVNNNRNMQPVKNYINVTCPGVTEQQVAERLGSVIGKELDKQFSGLHLEADQRSRIR